MPDLSLRDFAHRYLGITGGFSVVRDLLAARQITGAASLRSTLQALANAPLSMVVVGDSVAWGQGLRTEEKYGSKVAQRLTSELQPREVGAPRMYAHSGASILGAGTRSTCHGEVPRGIPTITTQVSMVDEELGGDNIDLVLMSPGINDVSLFTILSIAPWENPDTIRQATREKALKPLEVLLEHILETFPRAKIVITNYYQIISTDTNWLMVVAVLVALGIAAPEAWPWLIGASLVVRNKLDKQSEAFNMEFTSGVRSMIEQLESEIPNDAGRVGLADVGFVGTNAMGAPDALLYDLQINHIELSDLGDLDVEARDSVAALRTQDCDECAEAPFYCDIASVGHPNASGAARYADAIHNCIVSKGWLKEWKP